MTDQQFTQIVSLLTDIRGALVYLCEPDEPEPEPQTPPPCEHPEDRRIDFSDTREVHWSCQDCGHIERWSRATHAPAQAPGADAKE